MRLLIKNGRVIDPKNKTDGILDVYMSGGIIEEVAPGLDYSGADIEEIDAAGMIVAPGLVDMHCHLREPGQEYKEDVASGTKSAAAGGFTSVACMPNTDPVIDNVAVVEYIKARSKSAGSVNVFPIGAITKGLRGEELAEIGALKFAGVAAVSDDGNPVSNPALMRRALEYAQTFDLPVISHCEVKELADGAMNEGYMSTILGLRGISRAAEEIMVSRDILLASATKTAVHIAHVSTRGSVALVRRAKQDGVRVTCETCPHYFSLTEDAVAGYNTNAKMNPPLRTEDDVQAIIEGLRDGTIDAIATDHAPHHSDEKNCEFDLAKNGIVGFETAFSLGMTYLVAAKALTVNQLIEKMTAAPAEILGINKGTLSVGRSADIAVIDPAARRTVDVSAFHSKSKNSPYDGFVLDGSIVHTIAGGKFAVRDGIVL
ncbi:MAG: dihydroorotase [Clostridiales bacterium]|jgi:dihydroorotase|nr:dihydroorotase [Clostridiales bacterium]